MDLNLNNLDHDQEILNQIAIRLGSLVHVTLFPMDGLNYINLISNLEEVEDEEEDWSFLEEFLPPVPKGMTEEQIGILLSLKSEVKSIDSICSICHDPFDLSIDYQNKDIIILPKCKHGFHWECLHPWLKINRNCPNCRVEISD